MNIRGSRVALWITALAIASAAGWWRLHADAPASPPDQGAWIPIPEGGMDASTYVVRDLLDNFGPGPQHHWAGARPLSERCGDDRRGQPAEIYAAVIGDPLLASSRKVWSIEMTSSGDWLDVAIIDADTPPVPPEPTPGVATPSRREIRQVARHTVRKSTLADVRDAWLEPSLWLAPQMPEQCLDGYNVYLEACVSGRYHARSHRCSPAGAEAGMQLWQRLRAHFPDPPPMILR